MRFEVYPTRDRKGRHGYRWRLCGANSKVVASGEFYVSERNCLRAIARMKADVPNAPIKGGRP